MPDANMLIRLASFFNVSIDYLLGSTDIPYKIETSPNVQLIRTDPLSGRKIMRVPVLGTIRGGEPILADENIIDYVDYIVSESTNEQDYIALKVVGDNMAPLIPEGCTAIVKLQPSCEMNEICAVRINGEEATIKHVKILPDGMYLIPENTNYSPKFYMRSEVENLPIEIIGVVKSIQVLF